MYTGLHHFAGKTVEVNPPYEKMQLHCRDYAAETADQGMKGDSK